MVSGATEDDRGTIAWWLVAIFRRREGNRATGQSDSTVLAGSLSKSWRMAIPTNEVAVI